jgi:hypothetical protein
MSVIRRLIGVPVAAALVFLHGSPSFADDSARLLTIDHYVKVKSTVPVLAGQPAEIYVREKVEAGPLLRSAALDNRVVLFVHGAGTPVKWRLMCRIRTTAGWHTSHERGSTCSRWTRPVMADRRVPRR